MKPNIIYYSHNFNDYQPGGYTLAYILEDGFIRYGTAFCSPRDQYCRRTGRELAEERLATNPTSIPASVAVDQALKWIHANSISDAATERFKSSVTIQDVHISIIEYCIREHIIQTAKWRLPC